METQLTGEWGRASPAAREIPSPVDLQRRGVDLERRGGEAAALADSEMSVAW